MSDTKSNISTLGNVIIFKGDDDSNSDNDPYVLELQKLFLKCKIIPALKFEFNNIDTLCQKLSSPEIYSGLILSSPRCVEAVKKCGNLKNWSEHKIFCVGSKTASLVRELGVEPLGEQCGNAAALAEFILKDYKCLELPLLLPHGNLSLNTLKNVLTTGNMKLDCIEVYTTVSNPNINNLIKSYFEENNKVDYIVYMSPSAVNSTLSLLKNYQSVSIIKFVALGPTTASSLESNDIIPAGVADKPTPQHLASVISHLLSLKNS